MVYPRTGGGTRTQPTRLYTRVYPRTGGGTNGGNKK